MFNQTRDKADDLFRVLICEDDDTQLVILRYFLRIDGVQLVFAENGKQGVKALHDLPTFDLVITDLLMPEMNGVDFIRYIREVLKSRIPIIAISSDDNINEIEAAYRIGIDYFLVKPLNPKEIVLVIEKLMHKV